VDYALAWFANLRAGGSQGNGTATTYTLSTLVPPPPSLTSSRDTLFFGEMLLNYPITHSLSFRAVARNEHTRTFVTGNINYDMRMYLDYHLRMIYINFEYRWRQEHPENQWRTEQQLFYAKISRPF
jgi:hypothetical protein